MLNPTLLKRDAAGRLFTLTEAQIPTPNFNGGTPAANLGELVCIFNTLPGPSAGRVGGLTYTAPGHLHVANAAAIAYHTQGGLPVDSTGLLCIDASGTAPVTSFQAGVPFTAAGRVATVAGTFLNLHAFDGGFVQTEFN